MPLPDLCLLPHEAGDLAPGEPLCAPAAMRVRIWKWRCGGNYLLRRIKTTIAPQWVARRQSPDDAPLLRLVCPPCGQRNFFFSRLRSPRAENRKTIRAFKRGNFNRVIYFDGQIRLATAPENWRYALHIHADGALVWHSHDGAIAAFHWNDSRSNLTDMCRFNATDSAIQSELTKTLEDANCDCAGALSWLDLSRKEKDRQIYRVRHRVRRGTLDEFKSLLRAMILCENSGDEAKIWMLYFSSHTLEIGLNDGASLQSLFVSGRDEMWPTPRHKRLLELARREFGLYYALDLVRRRSDLQYVAWSDYVLEIQIPVPTAHQQIEARLMLRDFLRDKVSSTELAELMPQ